jgi:hypothetical protein
MPRGFPALVLDLMLYENLIVGSSKVVWIHTAFEPTIHHLLPHISFAITWFQLRDRSIILLFEHVASLH